MKNCDVRQATHVKLLDGTIEKISSKWGIGELGQLAKPSQGGFGVVTETGTRVDMYSAREYFNSE